MFAFAYSIASIITTITIITVIFDSVNQSAVGA